MQETHHIAAPADSHRRSTEQIFQNKVPTDDPGDEFTHRGVTVGIGTPGKGNHGSKLGVAKTGKRTTQRRQDKGNDQSRASIISCSRAGQHEYSGTDHTAHAQQNQVPSGKVTFQAIFISFSLVKEQRKGFSDKKVCHAVLFFKARKYTFLANTSDFGPCFRHFSQLNNYLSEKQRFTRL